VCLVRLQVLPLTISRSSESSPQTFLFSGTLALWSRYPPSETGHKLALYLRPPLPEPSRSPNVPSVPRCDAPRASASPPHRRLGARMFTDPSRRVARRGCITLCCALLGLTLRLPVDSQGEDHYGKPEEDVRGFSWSCATRKLRPQGGHV